MPVSYKDFISTASDLLQSDCVPEIDVRTSMSRAYYGFYHIALMYADAVNLPPVSDWAGRTHEKLSAYYEGNYNAEIEMRVRLRGIGYALKQNHRARCRADYKLDTDLPLIGAVAHLKSCSAKADLILELSEALAA